MKRSRPCSRRTFALVGRDSAVGINSVAAVVRRQSETGIVEHPELVAERLVRLARLVGRENVIASTDCGFAQGPFHRRVHETVQWAKLGALVEGARIATEALWP